MALDYASVDNSDVYLKFVVSDRTDIDEAGRAVGEYRRAGLECPVYPIPLGGRSEEYNLMYKKLRIFAWKEVGGSLHDYISRSLAMPGELKLFKKNSKYKLIQLDNIDVKKDPVRPELDVKFRTSHGRKIYGLRDPEGDVCAIMCFAFTDDVPKTVEEMDDMSKTAQMNAVHRAGQQGSIAIAYTVWAVKRGGGRRIVNEVYKMVKNPNNLNRLVIHSLTDMARKFIWQMVQKNYK